MDKAEILICNGKGHFLLWIEIEGDISPIDLYHEE